MIEIIWANLQFFQFEHFLASWRPPLSKRLGVELRFGPMHGTWQILTRGQCDMASPEQRANWLGQLKLQCDMASPEQRAYWPSQLKLPTKGVD